MKVLIVEDETAAYENLVAILSEIDASVEVMGNTESISQTTHWLQTNPSPDLLLMDIHLSDGSAFAVFKQMEVQTPVIFTTAYDAYALEAFRVNSIDYLLKPVKTEELKRALTKFRKWNRNDLLQYIAQLSRLAPPQPRYKDKVLVSVRDKLLPVDLKEVTCFYATERNTRIYLRNGNVYPYSKSLEQIADSLNPADFIRANKQFIISRNGVKQVTVWFNSRLLVSLQVETPERIYISKNKAAGFKAWLVNDI
ncbi:MAG: LytTR family DNA-binding domain-containing protein [Tannerellaceae bacterium]|jgi:DNA-binding LytR/AlgR family response regulator|nr:LytTR family DNA-binding domain-containing protein [Tannerellaceae bacterium]